MPTLKFMKMRTMNTVISSCSVSARQSPRGCNADLKVQPSEEYLLEPEPRESR
jgi:hypothetical protein